MIPAVADKLKHDPTKLCTFCCAAGLSIFYPGIVGRFLQTCCATQEPPHLIYCEPADSIAYECWFKLEKVRFLTIPDWSADWKRLRKA